MAGRKPTAAEARFAEKCRPAESGCIEWTGGKTKKGYGLFHTGPGKRMQVAHRWLYEQAHGTLPTDIDVCHDCDNPSCVRLDHLFPGTRKQNMEDAVTKGRISHVSRNVGEKHPMAFLNEEKVLAIRAAFANGAAMRPLSKEFGVSFQTISRTVRRLSWSHI